VVKKIIENRLLVAMDRRSVDGLCVALLVMPPAINMVYRACLVDANAVLWLLSSTDDASVQDNSVASLPNLSKHSRGRTALFDAGGVGLVVDVVNVGTRTEARRQSCSTFPRAPTRQRRSAASRRPSRVLTLVQILRDGAHRGRKNALVSLYGLLQCRANHGKAVAAGARHRPDG
jgi:hypothetical protein